MAASGWAWRRGWRPCGARVFFTGRRAEKNAAALAALPAGSHGIAADLTQQGAPEAVLAEVLAVAGRLDILVNNAGTNVRKRPEIVTDDEWHQVLNLNLTAVMQLTRAAYPALKAGGHGRVINVASILSIFATAFGPAYGASKGAIVQYTKSLAMAWAADGITANAVLPGWIETELTDGARADVPGLYEKQLARTPVGRWGRPGDLSGIAAFLASDEAAFVTGTAIPVDGGFAAGA